MEYSFIYDVATLVVPAPDVNTALVAIENQVRRTCALDNQTRPQPEWHYMQH
jgi:hypothetical protein